MSWVFLTGDRVYKLKKPVRYDFLDFSTLELRRLDCRRELLLNRRLAPDVYLGVVPPIVDERGRLRPVAEPDGRTRARGTIVDWLVEMRRLPAERMLDRRIESGEVSEEEVRQVAKLLARFYRREHPVPMTAAEYGRRFWDEIEVIRRELTDEADSLPRERVHLVADGLLGFLECRAELLDRRVMERRIVEAHGDLRPQHVCLTEPPVVIDCLEFRRDFRLLDPADELAYLAIERGRLGAPWIGRLLFATYRKITGDQPGEEPITSYQAFRAFLRGKIAFLHLREPERNDAERWIAVTRTYLELGEAKLSHERLGAISDA